MFNSRLHHTSDITYSVQNPPIYVSVALNYAFSAVSPPVYGSTAEVSKSKSILA